MEIEKEILLAILNKQLESTKPCLTCGKSTRNPKYCSKSCAAKRNGVLFPKRQMEGSCKSCRKQIPSTRTYCSDCRSVWLRPQSIPIGQIRGRKNNRNAQIRDMARRFYNLRAFPRLCAICGYDVYVEICHIRAISSFPDDTPINIVNHPSNLVALCPNHHWELDHGLVRATGVEPACIHYPFNGLEDRGDTPGEIALNVILKSICSLYPLS